MRDVAALAALDSLRLVLADVAVQERVVARLGEQPRDRFLATVGAALQGVHRLQPLERVLAVEHAGFVRALGLDEQCPASEPPVDRRAADQHGDLNAALVQLLHAERHLLARAHQQRRETDGVRPHLQRLLDDRVHRHLLAEIEHGVAVVAEDRVDERLADVVHVAIHGSQHDFALCIPFCLLEELLQMLHGALHHLRALEHEGEDQLTCAELVADVLHRGEQHVVQHAHRILAHPGRIKGLFDVFLLPVEDHPVDLLLRRHARGGIVLLLARRLLLVRRESLR